MVSMKARINNKCFNLKMSRLKHYDEHTLYVTSGVAREDQLSTALNKSIKNAEERYDNEILMDIL